jgi:hypothetical protein
MTMTFDPIAAISLEFISAGITPMLSRADPTGDVVQFAFEAVDPPGRLGPPSTSPSAPDWKTGRWLTGSASGPVTTYVAQCLVGPGGTTTLTPGDWDVWVTFTDNPEIPAKWCGVLTVY